jgi:site-specific DNA-methyltransferase (adenine-specific)
MGRPVSHAIKRAETEREEWRTPHGRLVRGDALAVLPRLKAESYDLIFADPPFNIGKAYGDSVDDDREREAYLTWCRSWLDQLVRLLAPGGSLFVYNLPSWNIHIATHLERKLTFRHWIAVDIKYFFRIRGRLYPAHYSLLYFCKGPKPKTFTPPRQPMVVCRHCGMELKDYGGYKDKLDPSGFNLSDVWSDLSPVRHHRYKRRQGLNELPVKMMDRIIDLASKPGDRILDPFAGSGTTLVVAELKRREWTGIEVEDVTPIVERFRTIDEDRKVLDELERSKNRLFTDDALLLRKRKGHALGRYRILDSQRALLGETNGHVHDPVQVELPLETT